jgi:hypothetical protein
MSTRYEHAYIDVAQAGARCQTLNSTFEPPNQKKPVPGLVKMAFSVDYITGPFTIIEDYSPTKENITGVYDKNAEPPIGKYQFGGLATLPTVVVDVQLAPNGQEYSTMTLYSCTAPLGATEVTELIFATREPTVDPTVLEAMIAVAKKQGIIWNDSDLKNVTRSNCKGPSPAPSPSPPAPTPAPSPTGGCGACIDSNKAWCYKDAKCYSVGSIVDPCASSQCCSTNSKSRCACKDCSDPGCQ